MCISVLHAPRPPPPSSGGRCKFDALDVDNDGKPYIDLDVSKFNNESAVKTIQDLVWGDGTNRFRLYKTDSDSDDVDYQILFCIGGDGVYKIDFDKSFQPDIILLDFNAMYHKTSIPDSEIQDQVDKLIAAKSNSAATPDGKPEASEPDKPPDNPADGKPAEETETPWVDDTKHTYEDGNLLSTLIDHLMMHNPNKGVYIDVPKMIKIWEVLTASKSQNVWKFKWNLMPLLVTACESLIHFNDDPQREKLCNVVKHISATHHAISKGGFVKPSSTPDDTSNLEAVDDPDALNVKLDMRTFQAGVNGSRWQFTAIAQPDTVTPFVAVNERKVRVNSDYNAGDTALKVKIVKTVRDDIDQAIGLCNGIRVLVLYADLVRAKIEPLRALYMAFYYDWVVKGYNGYTIKNMKSLGDDGDKPFVKRNVKQDVRDKYAIALTDFYNGIMQVIATTKTADEIEMKATLQREKYEIGKKLGSDGLLIAFVTLIGPSKEFERIMSIIKPKYSEDLIRDFYLSALLKCTLLNLMGRGDLMRKLIVTATGFNIPEAVASLQDICQRSKGLECLIDNNKTLDDGRDSDITWIGRITIDKLMTMLHQQLLNGETGAPKVPSNAPDVPGRGRGRGDGRGRGRGTGDPKAPSGKGEGKGKGRPKNTKSGKSGGFDSDDSVDPDSD